MASLQTKETAGQLQKGYRAVPISEADKSSPLRLCAIVREASDPIAGVFVLLGDTVEASLYLGCLIDVGGYVHQWIELSIQNINNLHNTLTAYCEALTNHELDERWKRRAAFLARADRFNKIELKSEASHPLPIYFDLAVSAPVNPTDEASSAHWELCRDDRLLEAHGLPPYSTSLARYLYLRDASTPSFIPITTGCQQNDLTKDTQVLGSLVPLNPDGGLMMARKFAPLGYEAYVDLLGGQPWKGLEEGNKVFKLAGVYRTLQNADAIQQGLAHLFLGKHGGAGRLIETFHLKLDLLLQAFRLVRDFVADEQLPLLNLRPDSFRVSLAETGSGLPFLWTAKVTLSALGSAFPLPIESTTSRYFAAPDSSVHSIYSPSMTSAPVSANGRVRIRKVLAQDDGTVALEGTISTQERISIAETDLIWLRLTVSSGRLDFYAHLTEGLAHGERRFHTLPQKFPDHLELAVRSAEGVGFASVPFQTLPMRSSPCDLYSLATIGVRTLLVNDQNTLAIALDEVLSLARAISNGGGEIVDTSQRVREICATDSRWSNSLGPHRLLNPQSLTVEESLAYLPAELWWDTIGLLVRCFPGAVPSSFCKDLGDAPPLALHSAFEPAINELERLVLRSRSMLFVDWKFNAEINSVVRAALQKHLDEIH
ncbi:MAG TPA: hypothetical protein VIS99_06235 [Terrimicrobiaceae bacterium]